MGEAELASIQAQIASLRAEVGAMRDRQAIADLIASYGPAVDRGDSMGAAMLWSQDGSYDLGDMGLACGPDAIATLLKKGDPFKTMRQISVYLSQHYPRRCNLFWTSV
jgi:hypothetical protein